MRSIFQATGATSILKVCFHTSLALLISAAFLVSVMRFVVAQCMVGSVDSLCCIPRHNRNLTRMDVSIVWNRAYRAMWFIRVPKQPVESVTFGMLRCD